MTQKQTLQDLDALIQTISDATGLKNTQISKQLEQANIPSFQFADTILVSPADLDPIIDAWAERIKAELTGSAAPSKAPAKAKKETPKSTPAPAKTKEAAPVLEATGDLSWPKGYEKVVTHLYTPTLKKVLPEDAKLRQKFIDAINSNSAEGESLVNELATTIVKQSKRKLSFDKVLAGLKDKIASMASGKAQGSPKKASTKRTTKKATPKKAPALEATGDLSWPKGYEKVVTHLYTPTLKKVLPEDKALRKKFITAIKKGTPDGEKLVSELATTIVKRSKRKLAFEKVLEGLKAKVSQM